MALARGLVKESGLALNRLQRKEVERAHPVQLQEGAHEEEVTGEDDRLLLVLDIDRLVGGRMAAGDPHPDAGSDLLVAVDDVQAPLLLEEAEVFGFVRGFT